MKRIEFAVLKWFLVVLESISARIRIKLGLVEPVRRSDNVILARTFGARRVPYGGPRTISRRKSPLPVTFDSNDGDE